MPVRPTHVVPLEKPLAQEEEEEEEEEELVMVMVMVMVGEVCNLLHGEAIQWRAHR